MKEQMAGSFPAIIGDHCMRNRFAHGILGRAVDNGHASALMRLQN